MKKQDFLKYEVSRVDIEDVVVSGRRRPLDQAKVEALKESIAKIGLMSPIALYESDEGEITLIAGAHRLEAMRQLGKVYIPACYLSRSDPALKLWEISENLHRADLTAMERAEHQGEWERLTGEQRVSRQAGAKLSTRGRAGEGRPQGGARASARELGVSEQEVRRNRKIDSLTPEAKAAARETGLDDNRSALLQAAKAPPERQAATIRDIARSKAPRRKTKPTPAVSEPLAALRRDWERAGPEDRQAFLAEIKATDGAG